ncbi:MAG TPA: lasso peptide biosynthesis B2 protein [Gaiellaceae bacterium]|nr:lasso peptide biosynthesis B2 protein [Gaiellaceae bacterium]
MRSREGLTLPEKARLAVRLWIRFAVIVLQVRREPLPALVERLARTNGRPLRARYRPATLSRAVHRSLRIGDRRPRCLLNALVLFRLLREQGEPAELVIGLLPSAPDQRAHAWVELDGRDVGPPPGRFGHEEMARLP